MIGRSIMLSFLFYRKDRGGLRRGSSYRVVLLLQKLDFKSVLIERYSYIFHKILENLAAKLGKIELLSVPELVKAQ